MNRYTHKNEIHLRLERNTLGDTSKFRRQASNTLSESVLVQVFVAATEHPRKEPRWGKIAIYSWFQSAVSGFCAPDLWYFMTEGCDVEFLNSWQPAGESHWKEHETGYVTKGTTNDLPLISHPSLPQLQHIPTNLFKCWVCQGIKLFIRSEPSWCRLLWKTLTDTPRDCVLTSWPW